MEDPIIYETPAGIRGTRKYTNLSLCIIIFVLNANRSVTMFPQSMQSSI